jgi:hypothetical protein
MTPPEEQGQQAQVIAAFVGVLLIDEPPGVIGATLAQLMSAFLISHKGEGDAEKQVALRTRLLADWCETVWRLVAVLESKGETMQ